MSDFLSVESNSPFVSIVLPVLNAEKTIGLVLQILAEQSYPAENYEIIVVDNGSSDRSVKIMTKFPVKLLHETRFPNSYCARNQGVLQARGDIIVFIDADCFPERDWLETLVRPFHDDSIGIVAGEVLSSHPSNLIQRFYEFSGLLIQRHKVSHQVPAIGAGNVAFRRDIFDSVGLFDESFRWGGDNDFGRRVQEQTSYSIKFAPKALVYHHHRESLRALIKHAYTYGLGKGRYKLKYTNTTRINDFFTEFFLFLRLAAGIPLVPLHTFKIYKSDRPLQESIIFSILDKSFCVIEQIGKLIFILTKSDVLFRKQSCQKDLPP